MLTSCSKEEEVVDDPGAAPVIPSSATFAMDLSAFPSEEGANNGRLEESKMHYGFAAINFVFWQSWLTVHLSVPVVAFKAALDQEATYIPAEKRWVWSFEVSEGQHTYEASLYAKVNDESVQWEMYVSKSDGFQDFLWYKGTSALDGTEGSWTVSIEPEKNAREGLFIEWEKEDDEVASIKYTSIDKDSENKDSYIAYGKTSDVDFDAYYHVYISSEENIMKIDFNSETKIGRVQSQKHFQDDAWHCWNSELADVDCED
uniref:Uncharacterized protein n=1 Tax=Roseihalotalea indica TaxID=2867963 RepID=A0AA49GTI0_9BACT|nr:hypothetical protein K4G66_12810 [Tunicatimonas sp. TK19036]